MAVDVAEAEPQAAVGMAVRVAGMAAVVIGTALVGTVGVVAGMAAMLIGTAAVGMVKAVAGITVVTVAAGESDPQ
jgi:hypothetical protein